MYSWRVTQVGSDATPTPLFLCLSWRSALKCGGFVVSREARKMKLKYLAKSLKFTFTYKLATA